MKRHIVIVMCIIVFAMSSCENTYPVIEKEHPATLDEAMRGWASKNNATYPGEYVDGGWSVFSYGTDHPNSGSWVRYSFSLSDGSAKIVIFYDMDYDDPDKGWFTT